MISALLRERNIYIFTVVLIETHFIYNEQF